MATMVETALTRTYTTSGTYNPYMENSFSKAYITLKREPTPVKKDPVPTSFSRKVTNITSDVKEYLIKKANGLSHFFRTAVIPFVQKAMEICLLIVGVVFPSVISFFAHPEIFVLGSVLGIVAPKFIQDINNRISSVFTNMIKNTSTALAFIPLVAAALVAIQMTTTISAFCYGGHLGGKLFKLIPNEDLQNCDNPRIINIQLPESLENSLAPIYHVTVYPDSTSAVEQVPTQT